MNTFYPSVCLKILKNPSYWPSTRVRLLLTKDYTPSIQHVHVQDIPQAHHVIHSDFLTGKISSLKGSWGANPATFSKTKKYKEAELRNMLFDGVVFYDATTLELIFYVSLGEAKYLESETQIMWDDGVVIRNIYGALQDIIQKAIEALLKG